MHQPLTLAHEEGVGGVNGEIIHLLGFVNVPLQPHPPGCAVRLVDLVAEVQVCGGLVLLKRGDACFLPGWRYNADTPTRRRDELLSVRFVFCVSTRARESNHHQCRLVSSAQKYCDKLQ
jgi:hypothetical protein